MKSSKVSEEVGQSDLIVLRDSLAFMSLPYEPTFLPDDR